MKQFGNLKTLFVAGTAVAALAALSSSQAQEAQGQGTVRSIKGGDATYQVNGGVSLPLKKGQVLPPGSTIMAGNECIVDVYLGQYNGPTLRVTGNTTVSLDTLTYSGSGEDAVSTTKLNLQDGRILGSVRKLGKDSTYEIKTPTGVAGIRGTDYDISTHKVNGQYASTYIALSGTIVGTDTYGGTATQFVANAGNPAFQSGNPPYTGSTAGLPGGAPPPIGPPPPPPPGQNGPISPTGPTSPNPIIPFVPGRIST